MSIYSSFFRFLGFGPLANPDEGEQRAASTGNATQAGISVDDDKAMMISSVWACVQYITNSVCSLPINFYNKTEDGRELVNQRHPLVELFHVKPNQLMKPRDMRKALTMQMVMYQNAYAVINYSGNRPVSIMPLKPGRMRPVLDKDGELTYHYSTQKGITVYSPKSIMHLKGFGVDGVVGMDRASYARQSFGISFSADIYASKQFANGGRSGGGYIQFDEFLTPDQRKQARELYSGVSETAYNANKIWLLEGGAKYVQDMLDPDKMQMIQTRKMQVSEIARFYGVPEILIGGGESTSAWPASFEQQLLSFLTFTLQDYVDEWEHAIAYSLLTPAERGKIIVDHDVSNFIKMDSVAKAQLQSTWVQNGLKSRNEIRRINNDPPVEGGDDLTVQVNLTPLEQLQKIGQGEQT